MGTTIRPKKNKNPKSRIKWGSSSQIGPHFLLSPSAHALFSFALLLSFLHCCFFPIVALFFALFFSLCCCSPLCLTALLFTLLGFFLSAVVLLFGCSFILGTRFLVLLFSSSCYYAFFTVFLVCCYSLNNLVLAPCIPSCRNWEWL